jgi:formylmethanofuran dehydrogenase subunit E
MQSLDELLEECEVLHGHMCPGQVLGARMALLGCSAIGISEPKGRDRKKLIVWVEIDRCMADAISASTGARLGKRSLKYVDYGKVAATFLNIETNDAVRIVALESSRLLADQLYPEIEQKQQRQFLTYRKAGDDELFQVQRVAVAVGEHDLPGSPRSRVTCNQCGEGVNDQREVARPNEAETLCRYCAEGGYYSLRD